MQSIEAAARDEKIFTVSEITSSIKTLIEGRFPLVWIVGEVSNCSAHSSGHVYFTLKDEAAQIRCVLFGGTVRRIAVMPEDGLKMYAYGRLTVYERQGLYELIVNNLVPLGRGELYVAFGKLKEKLEREGLFDEGLKKELPRFPSRVAVVTSPTGAAIRDVIRVATGIHAGVEIVVYPVRVQGEGAGGEIAEAVRFLNDRGGFDVIILARGGGSIEDLWAFNEEIVARAIAVSEIPVVSAVGHEIDFTIADFVADARAPTPSAAPTLVLAGYMDAVSRLDTLVERAYRDGVARIEKHRAFLESLKSHYGLRAVRDRVISAMRDLDETLVRGRTALEAYVTSWQARLAALMGKAEALSPLATLERGYSIVFRQKTGKVVRESTQVDPGDRLRIKLFRGSIISGVESTEEED